LTASELGGRAGRLGIEGDTDGSMSTGGGAGLSFPAWRVELEICPPE
jgi:hypothetical protein